MRSSRRQASVSAPARLARLREALRDRRGAAAIEFSMLLAPFLLLASAIMETGYQAYMLSSLDEAMRAAARPLQVGSAQMSGLDADGFRKSVCSRLNPWVKCEDVLFDVRPAPDYARMMTDARGESGNLLGALPTIDRDQTKNVFCPGVGGDVVLVRVSQVTKAIFGRWIAVGREDGGAAVLSTALTFRTEPFQGAFNRSASCASYAQAVPFAAPASGGLA